MKKQQCPNVVARYLIAHRENDHVMAAELAKTISDFLLQRGLANEGEKWHAVYEQHLASHELPKIAPDGLAE